MRARAIDRGRTSGTCAAEGIAEVAPAGAAPAHPLLEALGVLRGLYERDRHDLPVSLDLPVGRVWPAALTSPGRERAAAAPEVAALLNLRRALPNGTVWIECSLGLRSRLFDGMAEGLRIAADSLIPGDDGDQLRRLANLCRRGEVNCIERTDRFYRVRTAGAHQNGFGDAHDVATATKGPEPSKGGALIRRADAIAQPRTDEPSCSLRESQRRGDPATVVHHRTLRDHVLLEEGAEQRARLDISERDDALASALGWPAAGAAR